MPEPKKKMSLMQLTFIVAVNMMGSGIIMLPSNMAKVGAISLLSWIVTALGSMAIAYGFRAGRHLQSACGGMAALRRGRVTASQGISTCLSLLPVACRSGTSRSPSPRGILRGLSRGSPRRPSPPASG